MSSITLQPQNPENSAVETADTLFTLTTPLPQT